jgi:hypothetical protein
MLDLATTTAPGRISTFGDGPGNQALFVTEPLTERGQAYVFDAHHPFGQSLLDKTV